MATSAAGAVNPLRSRKNKDFEAPFSGSGAVEEVSDTTQESTMVSDQTDTERTFELERLEKSLKLDGLDRLTRQLDYAIWVGVFGAACMFGLAAYLILRLLP